LEELACGRIEHHRRLRGLGLGRASGLRTFAFSSVTATCPIEMGRINFRTVATGTVPVNTVIAAAVGSVTINTVTVDTVSIRVSVNSMAIRTMAIPAGAIRAAVTEVIIEMIAN
jgi:hypothetical protein